MGPTERLPWGPSGQVWRSKRSLERPRRRAPGVRLKRASAHERPVQAPKTVRLKRTTGRQCRSGAGPFGPHHDVQSVSTAGPSILAGGRFQTVGVVCRRPYVGRGERRQSGGLRAASRHAAVVFALNPTPSGKVGGRQSPTQHRTDVRQTDRDQPMDGDHSVFHTRPNQNRTKAGRR